RDFAYLASQPLHASDKMARTVLAPEMAVQCRPDFSNRRHTWEQNVSESNTYDVVILGGGSGGYATAFRATELGLSVALIEKDKVGGTCLHRGCIPTKALLHAGELADQAREGEQFGVQATFNGIDMKGVNAYKDSVV